MSVAGGVGKVLQHTRAHAALSDANLEVVKHFVENPQAFATKAMSAAQIGQNPFGDYAPQSTQIQGILKGMYDAFTSDLEKDNVEEANKQKSFEELFGTKMKELETLKATLEKQEKDHAEKNKKLAEDEAPKDDTSEQLAADEKFFEETKDAAESKAAEWSTRTRLRTEELAGMEGAIQILEGGSKTFQEATTTFLQLKSVQQHQITKKSFVEFKKLASKFRSTGLA